MGKMQCFSRVNAAFARQRCPNLAGCLPGAPLKGISVIERGEAPDKRVIGRALRVPGSGRLFDDTLAAR